jgi:hypothetical protein
VDNGNRGHLIVIDNATTANTTAGCPTSWTEGAIDSGSWSADADYALQWDDTARDENSVVATLANGYVRASATGSGASQTVTATSYDQYGVGIASNNLGMTLTGSGTSRGLSVGQEDEGSSAITNTFTTTRTTNSSGVATWGVSRDSAVSGSTTIRINDGEDNNDVETMYWTNATSATAVGDDGTNDVPNTFEADTDYADVDATGEVGGHLVALDKANDTVVVAIVAYVDGTLLEETRYVEYVYDSNDQFTVDSAGTDVATDIVGFEYYMGLVGGGAVGADTRYVAVDNLDIGSLITIKAASLTSVFNIDVFG